jgi:pimeloyl-ACP methyl ester carboxylesterase
MLEKSLPETTMPETLIIQKIAIRHAVLGDTNSRGVILMLHGWGANLDLMLPLGERLAKGGWRVLIPDLPGFGESAPPPTAWSVHDYVTFVLAYLDQLGVEKVHLFGHSFGGRLSLVLGAEHAARLGKIILADSAGVRPKASFTTTLRLRVYKGLRDGLRSVGAGALADRLQAWYSARYGSADYQAASGVMRETFVRVVNEDLLPYAARVTCSTLLLWGDLDGDTPLWQGQLLEKTIPDAGLVVFQGAGHYSYLDRLADTVKIMQHFLMTQ